MISVFEALSIIDQHSEPLGSVLVPLRESVGMVLAEDIEAPISLPPFRQSAMDGYAFRHGFGDRLHVIGESKAGDNVDFLLKETDAIRIFTGSRVPDQADTVIMQEHVERQGDQIKLVKIPNPGTNVRPIGEQIKQGDMVLQKGTLINAAVIGFLAGLGLAEVLVIRKPKIAILVTGNELQEPGTLLKPGAVYESNRSMLQAALGSENVELVFDAHVRDDRESTFEAIREGLQADVLLISGGISVGDYDFVKESLEKNGVEEKFYKVNQKPGKPLWFGKKDETLVFALPGNPASSLTCFLIYALAAIRKMNGTSKIEIGLKKGILRGDYSNVYEKSLFLQCKESGGVLEIYPKQASSMLVSFTMSNAFLFVPNNVKEIRNGDEVMYIPFNL